METMEAHTPNTVNASKSQIGTLDSIIMVDKLPCLYLKTLPNHRKEATIMRLLMIDSLRR